MAYCHDFDYSPCVTSYTAHIGELRPQSPCHFAWQTSTRCSQNLRLSDLSLA